MIGTIPSYLYSECLMKKLILVLMMLISFNALAGNTVLHARDWCNTAVRDGLIGFGIGAAVGVGIGVAIASTMPVAVQGAPMAIVYFTGAGKAALGAWVTNTVIPMSAISGLYTGAIGGIMGYGVAVENCYKLLRK
jgi:hypothetical protein